MKTGKYGYPEDEVGKVGYYDRNGNLLFVLTCKKNSREFYFLYEAQPDGSLKKIDKGTNPNEIEAKNHVQEIMRGEEPKQCKPTREKAARTATTRGTKRTAAKANTARSPQTE